MAKRKPKKPSRPKLRKWFPHRGPTWLKLEPAGLAAVGGLFFTTCSMVIYLIRQLTGAEIELNDIIVGITLTFVASYAGTGFFVWYMLHLAEIELDQPHAKPGANFEFEPDSNYENYLDQDSPMSGVPETAPNEEQP